MSEAIYKIMDRAAWEQFQAAGTFAGAPVDIADGFIHFSAAHQVQGTLDKHFAGRGDLVLVAVDPAALGGALRWEVSRGGELFPHLYTALALQAVRSCAALSLDAGGRHSAAEALAIASGSGG
ncbi:DUF952 domain-containing protein [Zavarzinia aquatilis]|uniref:DUF952 domain-containing protein n=1 Tax=Zavarzinia aquatilis TaxID=2211142 RepID=A0A317E422_9PROT|nr:DUF952 domain-containing protein [Zavarzinia aquatilis]PWR21124.1 DUF952 domain-containing protein [Zavarzinia aquatilis]